MTESLTRPLDLAEPSGGAIGDAQQASPDLTHTSPAGKAVSTIATAAASAIGLRIVRRWPLGLAVLAAVSLGAIYLQRRRAAHNHPPSDIDLQPQESMVA